MFALPALELENNSEVRANVAVAASWERLAEYSYIITALAAELLVLDKQPAYTYQPSQRVAGSVSMAKSSMHDRSKSSELCTLQNTSALLLSMHLTACGSTLLCCIAERRSPECYQHYSFSALHHGRHEERLIRYIKYLYGIQPSLPLPTLVSQVPSPGVTVYTH